MVAKRLLIGTWLLTLTWGVIALVDGSAVQAQDKKKDFPKGIVVGTLTAKDITGGAFIEVKADGEATARRYIPHQLPKAKGGGPVKEMLKVINGLTVGSRVEVRWQRDERLRLLAVKVLTPADKEKGSDK